MACGAPPVGSPASARAVAENWVTEADPHNAPSRNRLLDALLVVFEPAGFARARPALLWNRRLRFRALLVAGAASLPFFGTEVLERDLGEVVGLGDLGGGCDRVSITKSQWRRRENRQHGFFLHFIGGTKTVPSNLSASPTRDWSRSGAALRSNSICGCCASISRPRPAFHSRRAGGGRFPSGLRRKEIWE